MDIGSLPTDSLPKFAAVLGLAVFALSGYVPVRAILRTRERVHALEAEIAAIAAKCLELAEVLAMEFRDLSPERRRELHKQMSESRIALAVYSTKLAACRDYLDDIRVLGGLMILGCFIGGLLMHYGFSHWMAVENAGVTP